MDGAPRVLARHSSGPGLPRLRGRDLALWLVQPPYLYIADTRPHPPSPPEPVKGAAPTSHESTTPRPRSHTRTVENGRAVTTASQRAAPGPRNGERESHLHAHTSHKNTTTDPRRTLHTSRRRPLKRSHTGRRSSPGASTCTRTASSAAYAGHPPPWVILHHGRWRPRRVPPP